MDPKEPDSSGQDNTLPPQPIIRARLRRPRFSLVWLLPLVAIVIALSMAVHNWLQTGPQITIRFQTAEGLIAGKSQVRYKEVVIGTVRKIALSDDGNGVVVRVQLEGNASRVANSGTRFWVVRPQLGAGGISGLGTLMSGAYIGADAGDYANPRQTEFVGLEQPPAVTRGSKGSRYYLTTDSLGSLQIGSPVYFRRMQVGRVTSFALAENGQSIGVEIFVERPYDTYVLSKSRFWNASGVDVSVGSEGLRVQTESVASILAGGVAFGDPPQAAYLGANPDAYARAPAEAHFKLYGNMQAAYGSRDGGAVHVRMRYDQSVRGLAAGAPVELGGKVLGEVVDTTLDFDSAHKHFFIWVDAQLYPRQNSQAFASLLQETGVTAKDEATQDKAFVRYLAEQGYRAKLKTGNLLTGQLFVNIERVPNAKPFNGNWDAVPLMFPTAQGGGIEQLQTQLSNIAGRLEKVRFDEIGADLQKTLRSTTKALDAANRSLTQLTPEARTLLVDAQKALRSADATLQAAQPALGPGGLTDQAGEALQEVRKAAQSLRGLTDYLGSHPDALLSGRGKSGTPQPVPQNAIPTMQETP